MHLSSQMDIENDSHFHPQELYHKIVAHAGYITNITQTGGQYADLVEKLILPGWKQFMEWQSKAINYCIAEEHYEVIFSHMHNVDALGHQFWHWRKNASAGKLTLLCMNVFLSSAIAILMPISALFSISWMKAGRSSSSPTTAS